MNTWRPALLQVDANHGDQLATWLPDDDALQKFGESMDAARRTWGAEP